MTAQRPWEGRRLHFVGIGGAGMSGLAVVSAALGASVTGSDAAETPYLERVRALGISPVIGHAAGNLPREDLAGKDGFQEGGSREDGSQDDRSPAGASPADASLEVVVSTAISADNPERVAARERGVSELHRAELLAQVCVLRRCIAVSGTHGKSTTAAMLVSVLRAGGLEPSYLVGAELTETGANAEWGAGEWLVVEADESDRSLLHLHPEVAVVTNLELDHHSTYASRLDLEETMRRFLSQAGRVVDWEEPDVRLDRDGSLFVWAGVEVRLPVPGRHNALNAAAALEAARLAGVEPAVAAAALAEFRPAGRRFERVGDTQSGAAVYDDYAHHPTEVAATLAAARTLSPRRVVAAFQPHLYSRTAALWREFGSALAGADVCVVLDVYRAREDPAGWPGVSGRLIAAAAADAAGGRTVAWLPRLDDAEAFLRAELRAGDLLLTLGAGNVDDLARRLTRDAT